MTIKKLTCFKPNFITTVPLLSFSSLLINLTVPNEQLPSIKSVFKPFDDGSNSKTINKLHTFIWLKYISSCFKYFLQILPLFFHDKSKSVFKQIFCILFSKTQFSFHAKILSVPVNIWRNLGTDERIKWTFDPWSAKRFSLWKILYSFIKYLFLSVLITVWLLFQNRLLSLCVRSSVISYFLIRIYLFCFIWSHSIIVS